MNNSKTKILITGGFGYVGSKLCQFLTKHNYNISIIDNLLQKNFDKKILSKIEEIVKDLKKNKDHQKFKKIFSNI